MGFEDSFEAFARNGDRQSSANAKTTFLFVKWLTSIYEQPYHTNSCQLRHLGILLSGWNGNYFLFWEWTSQTQKFSLLLSLHLINSTLLGFVNFKRWKSGGGSWMKRYSSLTEWWKVQSWHKIKVTVIHSVIGIGKHHISKFTSALLQKLLFSNSFQLYQHIASKIVESFRLTT